MATDRALVEATLQGEVEAFGQLLLKYQSPLLTTAEGYFNCAPEVTKAIRWQQGTQSYPYAQFAKEYHRPELVRKALAEEGISGKSTLKWRLSQSLGETTEPSPAGTAGVR